jgi:hypothetical protein
MFSNSAVSLNSYSFFELTLAEKKISLSDKDKENNEKSNH